MEGVHLVGGAAAGGQQEGVRLLCWLVCVCGRDARVRRRDSGEKEQTPTHHHNPKPKAPNNPKSRHAHHVGAEQLPLEAPYVEDEGPRPAVAAAGGVGGPAEVDTDGVVRVEPDEGVERLWGGC